MISSIFEKTKPINYVIVFGFLAVFYWLAHFLLFSRGHDPEELVWQLFVLGALLFSLFVVNFICHRNKITGTNSYALLFYAMLMLVFPETMTDSSAILCSFFLLLATRRIISLKSLRNIKLKIFDATIWIMTSSLFYNWAILYLLLVLAAIYIYEPKNIRNWLVPFAGIFTVFAIAYCVLILIEKPHLLGEHYKFSVNFNSQYFFDWNNSTRLIIYILATSLAALLAFIKLGKSGLGKIITMRLIALSFGIGIVLKILTTSENTYPVILTFFPAVVFMTNYLESIKRPNIKEIILMLSVFIPIMVFFIGLILK
ncbi:DUF6427 family protein [Ulvibacterium marinum]|uniref:DUF6427 family protein n=1 Tax=Ulvibacterium marinum TaxID=2419782 RepID=UPI0024955DE1|nr:DUF6427 family protein [Ulvibacterium marinum]